MNCSEGYNLRDTRIKKYEKLVKPNELIDSIKPSEKASKTIVETRTIISNIIKRLDNRLLFIVGPCSIHNKEQAIDYGYKLNKLREKVSDKIIIVMRTYMEKPRTSVGWKGFINDPYLNGSYNINEGLKKSRELLCELNDIGLPCSCEILDTITPQYISDLISWGAIGARTSESQVHRQIVSGLSMPIGYKNSTSGDVCTAAYSIISSRAEHTFMAITGEGQPALCQTTGNEDCHLILRGGKDNTNYDSDSITEVTEILKRKEIDPRIMVDCSHGNSLKNYKNQPEVFRNVIEQIKNGNQDIFGIMIESNINEGKQKLDETLNSSSLKYGVSVTDCCINFDYTEKIIMESYNLL